MPPDVRPDGANPRRISASKEEERENHEEEKMKAIHFFLFLILKNDRYMRECTERDLELRMGNLQVVIIMYLYMDRDMVGWSMFSAVSFYFYFLMVLSPLDLTA